MSLLSSSFRSLVSVYFLFRATDDYDDGDVVAVSVAVDGDVSRGVSVAS